LTDTVFRKLGEQKLNERETNVIRVFFSMITLVLDNRLALEDSNENVLGKLRSDHV